METFFDHEKLEAYKVAIGFAEWSEAVLKRIPKGIPVHGQLDRARTSIVLNIAEGNGRFTAGDRCKFFDIARGSGLECAACIDLLFIKKLISATEVVEGKSKLRDAVCLLVGLIRSNSPTRLHEQPAQYQCAPLTSLTRDSEESPSLPPASS
jgi:four helix bundle protein